MKKDKINHIFAGLMVTAFIGLPCYLESINLFAGLWSALWTGILAGGIKEWCDNKYNWKWDWRDFAATCLGAIVVALLILGMHFGKG